MALFRALSTRRSQRGGGYDRLLDETVAINGAPFSDADHHHHHEAVLKRVTSVPASMLFGTSSSKKPAGCYGMETTTLGYNNNSKPKQPKQGKGKKSSSSSSKSSSHPVFSLFDGKWNKKKKITANPDFSRYIEYLKEGGMLSKGTNSPVI